MEKISLKDWRFSSFLAATFLGAFNDNALKLVVSMASLTLIIDPAKQQSYLAITSALAILPFILFSGYAGYLADRFAKHNVLRISKAIEIFPMIAALIIFMTGQNLTHLLIALFLLAMHSAFFSPSKYGILPEILNATDLPKANGYLNMLTFVAIILGSLGGATLWGMYKQQPEIIGFILTGIAVLGTLLCLFVPHSVDGNPAKTFKLNPFSEIARGVSIAYKKPLLASCMFGSAMFWMLGGLIYLSLILLGKTQLGLSESASGSLFAFLASGIAVGSVVAGHLVGKTVRRTLSVWGAIILVTGCILTGFYATDYTHTAILMGVIGIGGGLFIVPIVTMLQKHSPEELRGQILATSGFFDMVGVLLASGLFWLGGAKAGFSPAMIILAAGSLSLLGLIVAIYHAPKLLHEALESAIYFIARRVYRVRLVGDGLENGRFPQPTIPTVFIANHVTFLDGLFLSMLSPKPIRYMVLSTYWKKPLARFVLDAIGAIPFGTGNINETRHGLEAAREAIARGEYVCIFPEGVLTRTGHLHPFKRGIEKLLEGTDAQVVPVYLERLWGSIFSFAGQRFFTKLPRSLPYPVTVAVGKPLAATTPAWKLNHIISELGTDAVKFRYNTQDTLGRHFIIQAKRHPFAARISDTTGQKLNGMQTLVGARLIAQWLRPFVGETQNVAVLIPASAGGALANIALALLSKTSVNLNFSLGIAAVEQAIVKSDVVCIITTHKIVKKLGLAEDVRMLFLDDVAKAFRPLQKLHALVQALLLPHGLLCRHWLKGDQRNDATATILFSSGSTAEPKAVMLSHAAIIANIDSVNSLLMHAGTTEVEPFKLAGTLPFFHSFGLTVCLWLPAITGRRVAYHSNPLEAKTVISMIAKEQCHVLITTPTFARHYTGVAKEHALDSVRLIILGGEKLTDAMESELTAALPKAYILQGYGCTELAPIVAINVPDIRHNGLLHRGYAKGSVGHAIPGVTIRIADREDGSECAPGIEGLILIKSPSLMQGYYRDEALTREVTTDGWYFTGDIGVIDKNGFLVITDRLARFSKIGGEMVPHGKIEDAAQAIVGSDGSTAIVAIPDASKGERLCLLTTATTLSADELHTHLKQSGLPNLWIPARDSIFTVSELPCLATGKRDLRATKRLAEELVIA